MIIWTHRGFPNQENTLAAFEAAYEAGIRHFETDIHATLDGELILSHDVGTNRLIEEDFHIPSMNFSELVRLTGNRYQWCRLVELLDKYDDVKISIDVKHSFAVEPLIKLLRQRNTENLIIGSFSGKRVEEIISKLPDITTSLTPREITSIKFRIGHKKLKGLPRYAMVPIKSNGMKIVTRRFINRCEELGIPVYVWTINNKAEANYLTNIGASGIVTDNFKLFP